MEFSRSICLTYFLPNLNFNPLSYAIKNKEKENKLNAYPTVDINEPDAICDNPESAFV